MLAAAVGNLGRLRHQFESGIDRSELVYVYECTYSSDEKRALPDQQTLDVFDFLILR